MLQVQQGTLWSFKRSWVKGRWQGWSKGDVMKREEMDRRVERLELQWVREALLCWVVIKAHHFSTIIKEKDKKEKSVISRDGKWHVVLSFLQQPHHHLSLFRLSSGWFQHNIKMFSSEFNMFSRNGKIICSFCLAELTHFLSPEEAHEVACTDHQNQVPYTLCCV